MTVSSRVRAARFLPILLLIGAPLVSAQTSAPPTAPAADPEAAIVSRAAWLYKGSDIAPDPAWHFGTLRNGLRYAVRKNGVPPGQVSIRVRIDAGSLMETDPERGYAHLIEHLSFRSSVYVPDGEAKRIWQRMGTTFGSDTNAQTTPTQTVYKLDLPSATEDGIGESLKILSGMMAQPVITQTALKAELPAVLAEQREGSGAQARMFDALNTVAFAGQPLADRSPIGHVKELEAATGDTVKAFHDRWYRPERALVVIAGDVDPAVLERLVAETFAGWRGIGPAPAEPDFGQPDPKRPMSKAIVEPSLPTLLRVATVRPWHYNDDTIVFNQQRLADYVALSIINRRLETRARSGGTFLRAAVQLDDQWRSANITSLLVVPVGDAWQAALKDVRAVIADAQASPPSKAEIEREIAEQRVSFKTLVDTARAEAGGQQADNMVQAVDIRETTTAPAAMQQLFVGAVAHGFFKPSRILESTRRVFQGTTRALITTPTPASAVENELAQALSAPTADRASRTRQGKVDFSDLPRLGPPATVVTRQPRAFGTEQAELSNGVRVLVYPSTSEDSRVYVRVRFGGGYNALPATRETPAWADDALVPSGIGKLRQGDLDALMTGRRLGLEFGVDEDAFVFGALTSPQELGNELRLIEAKLQEPAWDPAPLLRDRSVAVTGYRTSAASPDAVLSRDLERLLHDGDPRFGTPSLAAIEATTPESFRALWEPLLKTGPVEVMVFGDVTADDAIAAVARTIGTLPRRLPVAGASGQEGAVPPVRFPAHVTTPVARTHDGPANQAAAVIAWPTGGGLANITESRRLDVLAAIFADRLYDQLRSQAGASYSPNVASSWPTGFPTGGRLAAVGLVAPENLPLFFRLSREIAADLVSKPIEADELQRTVGPMQQLIQRQSTGNQFWMNQLDGATYEPARFEALRHLLSDLGAMTAADLQATAAKYLTPDRDWTMQVVPASTPGRSDAPAAAPVDTPSVRGAKSPDPTTSRDTAANRR